MADNAPIRVLLTDDSASFLHFEKVLLSGTGYEFITATTGPELNRIENALNLI